MNTFRFILCVCVIYFFQLNAIQADTDGTTALNVIAEAYSQNRDAFSSVDCHFSYKKGRCADISSAMMGKFESIRSSQEGDWLVNGDNIYYRLLCEDNLNFRIDEKAIQAAKARSEPTSISVPCSSQCYLKTEKYSLCYTPITGAANIFGPTDTDGFGIRVTPFNIDFMGTNEFSSPASYLRDSIKGRFVATFEGRKSINETDCAVVKLKYPKGEMVFAFDPQRGYSLIFQSDSREATGVLYEVYFLEYKECSGNRWFPVRLVKLIRPKPNGPIDSEYLSVDYLETEKPPTMDRFSLTLPKGTQANIPRKPAWYNIEAPRAITPSEIKILYDKCIANGLARIEVEKKATAISSDLPMTESTLDVSSKNRNRIILILVNIAFVLIIGYYVFFRRQTLKK